MICWSLLTIGRHRTALNSAGFFVTKQRRAGKLLTMLTQRWRPVFFSIIAVVAIWVVALVGYRLAKGSTVTAEKVKQYVDSVDLTKLSGAARAKAIMELAHKLNALSLDERRLARMERIGSAWFEQMTGEEKATFIEATSPPGFKQML